MLLFFIILYLLVTIAIGWWSARFVKNRADFVVAGRSLPFYMVTCGLFAEWFGSETLMGSTKEFLDGGILAVIEEPFGAALCLILVGLLIARPLYRMNILTFSDYFRKRFNKNAEIVSVFMVVPSYFGWIAAQLIALAIVFQVISGLPLMYGIFLCAGVVMIYTYIGGMWAVSITDFVQTIMIIVGLLIVLFAVVSEVGGFGTLISSQPEGFFDFTPKENTAHHWIEYIVAWITVGFGSVPQQDVFQRVISAKDENTAVRASYAAGFLYLTIAFIPLFIGLAGKMLYPQLVGEDADKQMLIPQMVLQHSHIFVQVLFFGALLSAIMSTTSGAILAPATVIGENLIKPFLKNPTDKQVLWYMRMAVIGVTLISAWIATLSQDIFDLVRQSSSISLVGLFIPLMAGIYWKKTTSLGAIFSMAGGMLTWVYFEFFVPITLPTVVHGLFAGSIGLLVGTFYEHFFKQKKASE
jgi:solute:Na+ symporter, SSS family